MRVFVTGPSGFVGRHFIQRLRRVGHEPLGVEREHDVTDPDDLGAAIEAARPDAIVHLAAQSSVAESYRQPVACYRVNFLGTANLLEAVRSRAPAARVLLVGSGDEYGPASIDRAPYREGDPLAPRNPYAATKAAAEWLGTRAADSGLDVVRVRPFNHTGPGQSDRFVASSFARQVAEIVLGMRPPRLRVGNLDSVRDFLDVADVVDAYVALLDRSVPAAVYNIAGGRKVAIREILETLLQLSGVQARIEVDPERLRPTDALVGDSLRLREATGWSVSTPLTETLRALLEDWKRRLSGPVEAPSVSA